MPDYTLYSLDGVGRIVRAERFTATGDEEALMIVRAAKKRVNCELWSRDRLVAKIAAHQDWPFRASGLSSS